MVEVAKLRPRKEKCQEDLSDEAFIRRHEAAELEEVELWDRWKCLREEEGRGVTGSGRSTSSGWREADLGLDAPRLRSQRVGSSGSPGRLSPSSMEKVKEICVLASTPVSVQTVQTVRKVLQTNDGTRKMLEFQSSDKRKSLESVSSNNQNDRKKILTTDAQLERRKQEENLPLRRKTTGSSRLRRSLPDILSKENLSCHLLNRNTPGTDTSQPDRILKDSNVEEKKIVQQKTR